MKISIKTCGSLSEAKALLQSTETEKSEKVKISAKVINSITARRDPAGYFPKKNDMKATRIVQTDFYDLDCDRAEQDRIFEIAYKLIMEELSSVLRFITRTYVIPSKRDPEDLMSLMVKEVVTKILPSWNPEKAMLTTYTKAILQRRVHRLCHVGDAIHFSEEHISLWRNLIRWISDRGYDFNEVETHMDEICRDLKTRPDKVQAALEIEAYEHHSSLEALEQAESEIADSTNTFTINITPTSFEVTATNDLIMKELKDFAGEWLVYDDRLVEIGVELCIKIIALSLGLTDTAYNEKDLVRVLWEEHIPGAKNKVDTVLSEWVKFEKLFAKKCLEKDIIG